MFAEKDQRESAISAGASFPADLRRCSQRRISGNQRDQREPVFPQICADVRREKISGNQRDLREPVFPQIAQMFAEKRSAGISDISGSQFSRRLRRFTQKKNQRESARSAGASFSADSADVRRERISVNQREPVFPQIAQIYAEKESAGISDISGSIFSRRLRRCSQRRISGIL